jgi:hypothetical protein
MRFNAAHFCLRWSLAGECLPVADPSGSPGTGFCRPLQGPKASRGRGRPDVLSEIDLQIWINASQSS